MNFQTTIFQNVKRAIALSLALTVGIATQAAATPIKAYTAVLPPFTLGDSADMPGISHDMLVEMAHRANVEVEFVYLPWKRSQAEAQKHPGSLILTIGRSAAREDSYGWITEVLVTNEVFATTGAAVNSIKEAQALNRVSTLAGTPRERRLKEAGLSNLQASKDTDTAARLLTAGRVDAWYTFDHRALYAVKASGINPDEVTVGTPIRSTPLWLASHLDFDPAVAKALSAALADMHADGTYDTIMNKYLK